METWKSFTNLHTFQELIYLVKQRTLWRNEGNEITNLTLLDMACYFSHMLKGS